MRTTVTLDADVEALVRRRMSAEGVGFKTALNAAIRAGATESSSDGPSTRVRSMGVSTVPLDRALQLAGLLEDDELIRRMRTAG